MAKISDTKTKPKIKKPLKETPVSASSRLKKFGNRLSRTLARSSLPEVIFISTFILGRYYKNSDFSYPSEVILPIILFAVLLSAIYYIYRFIFRGRAFTAHLAALPLSYALYSFQYIYNDNVSKIKAVLPHNLETPFVLSMVLALAMAIILGVLAFGLVKLTDRLKLTSSLQLPKILIFVIAFLFISQAYKVSARIWQIRGELTYQHKTTMPSRDSIKSVSKPNIYYIVTDRYTNSDELKNVYNYDNSDLTNFLTTEGFSTNTSAYSNYPFTMSSISSTMSMGYHNELGKKFGNDKLQTGFPYRDILNDPPIAQVLKQNGYTYNQVSSWWDFTRVGIKADNNPTKSFRFNFLRVHIFMSDLSRDILNKSILSPLLKKGITYKSTPILSYDRTVNPRQNFEQQMTALKDIADGKNKGPQFTFAHILVPHDPYIFSADGSDPNYSGGRDDYGADENVKYTNAVTYLNTRLKDEMAYIRKHDPGAAIVIQADEGSYPKDFRFTLTPDHFYKPTDLSLPKMQQKFGILASYYMPGLTPQEVSQQIQGSVNPFRFILSHYLGYSIDQLPNCNFSTGNKFKVFDYIQVTGKLTGQQNPKICDQYN
ncbi:MAG: hypothetical protein ABI354_01115 [Candidatus Saccharimonadales bacterium]